tara:strand:+ start:96 stop:293 length:198 start_codon:yes stop_codon:yes gene_type:complete
LIFFIIEPFLLIRLNNLYNSLEYVPELTFILAINFLLIFFVLFLFGLMFDIQENKEISIKIPDIE